MESPVVTDRFTMITVDHKKKEDNFGRDVREGLSAKPKSLPCIYFYDYKGSQLFEQICDLPEYYPTRCEAEILDKYAVEIVGYLSPGVRLVELGSGSSVKTRYLLDELSERHNNLYYSPIDISAKMLKESALNLLEQYSDLEIVSVAAEYNKGLQKLNMHNSRAKLILWLGSSIGNLEPKKAIEFLNNIVQNLTTNDFLLIGFDLLKELSVLLPAYDDARGVTAAFNLNLLERINRELDGTFNLNHFDHKAVFNKAKRRIEMHLESKRKQTVDINGIQARFDFEKGERIHTENSHKYAKEDIGHIAEKCELEIVDQWFDSNKWFGLYLFRPKSG